MGLRDMLRAIREYPTVSADLETVRTDLQQTKQSLERSTQECARLEAYRSDATQRLRSCERKLEAYQAVLETLCPKQTSLAEMKRFYDTISPSMDAKGLTLYRTAKKMTGIDLHAFFPQEKRRGMFDAMDARQLLDCLMAVRFGAVDWEGLSSEKTRFREVDTSSAEYQAFEAQLYEKVLEQMGFGGILAPKQEVNAIENRTTELKLYNPLRAELVEETPVREWVDELEPPSSQVLAGDDLSAPVFRAAILQGIENEQAPEEEQRGLMTYFYGSDAVNEKVVSVFPSVEEVGDRLYGVAVCQIRGALSPNELAELKEFCVQQYAGGWGEGYEQRPRRTEYGDLYVSFWQEKGFFILTKEEMDSAKVPSRTPHQPKRGGEVRRGERQHHRDQQGYLLDNA